MYDDWSSIVIHVAMDNTVIEDDISKFVLTQIVLQ